MITTDPIIPQTPLRARITQATHADESGCVNLLLQTAQLSEDQQSRAQLFARELVENVRKSSEDQGGLDSILEKYDFQHFGTL